MTAAQIEDETVQAPPTWRANVQHIKTHGLYQWTHDARVQTDVPLYDMDLVSVYRGIDGAYWVRRWSEFHDHERFKIIATAETTDPLVVARRQALDEAIGIVEAFTFPDEMRMPEGEMLAPDYMRGVLDGQNSTVKCVASALRSLRDKE